MLFGLGLSCFDLQNERARVTGLPHGPAYFAVGCLGWKELNGFVVEPERLLAVDTLPGVVIRGVVQELPVCGMDCDLPFSDG